MCPTYISLNTRSNHYYTNKARSWYSGKQLVVASSPAEIVDLPSKQCLAEAEFTVDYLVSYISNFEAVNLHSINVSDELMFSIAAHCPQLTEFYAFGSSEVSLTAVSLKNIHFGNCTLLGGTLLFELLTNLPRVNMQSLSLLNNPAISCESIINFLAVHPNLTSLIITTTIKCTESIDDMDTVFEFIRDSEHGVKFEFNNV